jgi:hypothetical protein
MTGTIHFQFDSANEVHVATPRWSIETEDDCRIWFKQYEDYFKRFSEKVDVIFVLEHFRMGNGIGSIWGRYRAEINNRFTRYSIRVHANAKVSTFIATSSAIHSAPGNEARDIPAAIALLKEWRKLGSLQAG